MFWQALIEQFNSFWQALIEHFNSLSWHAVIEPFNSFLSILAPFDWAIFALIGIPLSLYWAFNFAAAAAMFSEGRMKIPEFKKLVLCLFIGITSALFLFFVTIIWLFRLIFN
ncbi:MAG: hypothetical protein OER98_03645 [Gammaproteobacteria bacterium]|nr:hypothetical protein [Gammaproteobacteria bacterium]